MKRLSVLIAGFFLTLTLSATEVKFVSNLSWKQIKEKAAREKKMIFFDAYASWCGPCKYLEQSVYTDAAVATYYNANFINVKFDMEKGEGLNLSEEFAITSYPTLLFFTPEGKLAHKYIGAMEAPAFISLGKDARDPARQYYSLKEKVAAKTAADDEFATWAKTAKDLEDEDLQTLAGAFLAGKKDILASAGLAKAVINYCETNEAQLSYLYANKKKLAQLLQQDAATTEETLYRKLFILALDDFDEETGSLTAFSAIINKYEPARLNYAVHEVTLVMAMVDPDASKISGAINDFFTGTKRLKLADAASLLLNYVTRLEEETAKTVVKDLALYVVSNGDKGQEGWLYLVQTVCYAKAGDMVNSRAFAKKAYDHPVVPQDYKDALKESYGL